MFRKQELPTTVFFAVTIVSAGLLILPMWNYFKFYSALYNFDYIVKNVTIDTTQITVTNHAVVNITLLATNPTDYSGLQVSYVACGLKYWGDSHQVSVPTSGRSMELIWTNWWDLKGGSTTQWYSIEPNGNRTILLQVFVSPNSGSQGEQQNAWDFMNYLETARAAKQRQILWSLSCVLTLNSFLGSFDRNKDFTPVTPLS